MLSRWPIRNKLLVGLGLLLIILITLSVSGFSGVYAYRGLVKSLRARADELPLATALSQQVSDLRAVLLAAKPGDPEEQIEAAFKTRFEAVEHTLAEYCRQIESSDSDQRIGDTQQESEIADDINSRLSTIAGLTITTVWRADQPPSDELNRELEALQQLTAKLPSQLHRRLGYLAGEVRAQYHWLIAVIWFTALLAAAMLAVFLRLFYRWVFYPLRQLVEGSRRVAGGDFTYRIRLTSSDEMAELAEAMNDMTARFQAVRDDLDRQVQLRTRQVVRSEQLASVGFLAAGVAHEINNPLASIAMCAESLESRLAEFCQTSAEASGFEGATASAVLDSDQVGIMQHYLRMIQSEAFRCKGITEKLLDFSRIGEVKHQTTDLRELVAGVVEMVRHLGKYQDRHIVLDGQALDAAQASGSTNSHNVEPILANVNAQEIKQVVLNLITNALDSLDPGGTLTIELRPVGRRAEMIFTDDGCGMTDEVLAHLFEPFFTRKRGGQGTGLGLSIVYRIVTDHGGQIDAESDGPGRGSRFRVTLPLAEPASAGKERSHRYQAA